MKKTVFNIVLFLLCISPLLCQNKTNKELHAVYNKKLDIPYTLDIGAPICFFITDSTLYIGTQNGLFISNDKGKTWKLFDKSLENTFIKAIFIDESETIYAGTNDGLLDYSAKQKQWKLKSPSINIISMCINGDTIILGSGNNSILLTRDNGKTWERKEKLLEPRGILPFGPPTIKRIVCDGKKIFLATSDGGLALSLDNGNTWKKIDSISYPKIETIALYKNNLFLSGNNQTLYSSADNGKSWKKEDLGMDKKSIYSIFATESRIYVLTSNGIYNQNSGEWTYIKPDKQLHFNPYFLGHSFFVHKNMMIADTKKNRILLSEDSGKTWKKNIISGYYHIFAKDDVILCGTHSYGFDISKDNGKTWNRVSVLTGLDNDDVISLDYTEGNIIIGTRYSIENGGGVFRSNDFGSTWSHRYLKDHQIISVKRHGRKVYVTSRSDVKNFHVIDLETNQVQSMKIKDSVRDCFIMKDRIYLTTMSGKYHFYVSKDMGQIWKGIILDVNHLLYITSMAFLKDTIIIGSRYNGMIIVNDEYEVIKRISNLPGKEIFTSFTKDNTIFISTEKGLIISNDTGTTWRTIADFTFPFVDMYLDSVKLYVAANDACHVLDIVEQ